MEPVWAEALLSVGVGVGLAAAAGLRVFLPLLVLGAAARLGWVPLTSGFEWLSSSPGLATLGAATVVEIAAYYIPWVDNLLDVLAAPLAILAGVVATAAVVTDLPPAVRWSTAIIAGGGTAAVVQGVTSLARLKSSALTAGLGNPILAALELAGSLAVSVLAIAVPVLGIVVVVGVVWAVRRMRRGFRRRPLTS